MAKKKLFRKGEKTGKVRLLPFVTALLGLLLVIQMVSFYKFKQDFLYIEDIAKKSTTMLDEMGMAKDYLTSFGSDLNEIRSYLLLPTTDYDFSKLGNGTLADEEEDDLTSLVFTFVEQLGAHEKNEKLYSENFEKIQKFLGGEEFLALGLSVDPTGKDTDDGALFKVTDPQSSDALFMEIFLGDNGKFDVQTYVGVIELSDSASAEEVRGEILRYSGEVIEKFRSDMTQVFVLLTELDGVFAGESVQAILAEKSLRIGSRIENIHDFRYSVDSLSKGRLMDVVVDKADFFVQVDEKNVDKADLEGGLVQIFEGVDSRTDIEILVEERAKELSQIMQDPGFLKVLEDAGFTIGEKEETADRISYPIIDEDGEILRSLYLDKRTSEVQVEVPGGGAEDLAMATHDLSVKKKTMDLPVQLASYNIEAAEGRVNILLCGKHGSNVDTIMLASFDSTKRSISLVSIPRDLYHMNRKVNSIYADFGMYEMVNRLEDITGQKIDHYVLVDMYAFRDIVDLLGGITVTLEEDLIDPTYKTCDGDKCSTLYYKAGTYEFNGTEALRVARSRHTTSDYSRAERQQIIIEALKDKAKTFGVGDAGTLFKLANTVIDATETDISPDEAIAYFFRYQNFDLDRGNVLSTANVLASEKEPVNYFTSLRIDSCAGQEGCKPQYAIYTLVPRAGDWNVIRWYVSSILND
ncbi:LCP family protein [Patescibacteria group bacterium]|nr:LCP family protein [Patescibacteria group bacterium]